MSDWNSKIESVFLTRSRWLVCTVLGFGMVLFQPGCVAENELLYSLNLQFLLLAALSTKSR